MLKSKYFAVMGIITLLVICAVVVFQALEMRDYNLFTTLLSK